MNLNIQVDIKGGDEYLGYAKKKLYALLDFMKSVKVPFFTQKIYVSDGTTIDLYANFYGFQRIRIRGGVPSPILLYDFTENKWIAFNVKIEDGNISLELIDLALTVKDYGNFFDSPVLTVDRKIKKIAFSIEEDKIISPYFWDGTIFHYGRYQNETVFLTESGGYSRNITLGMGTYIVKRPHSYGNSKFQIITNSIPTYECAGRNNFALDENGELLYKQIYVFITSLSSAPNKTRVLGDVNKTNVIKVLPTETDEVKYNHICVVGLDTLHTKKETDTEEIQAFDTRTIEYTHLTISWNEPEDGSSGSCTYIYKVKINHPINRYIKDIELKIGDDITILSGQEVRDYEEYLLDLPYVSGYDDITSFGCRKWLYSGKSPGFTFTLTNSFVNPEIKTFDNGGVVSSYQHEVVSGIYDYYLLDYDCNYEGTKSFYIFKEILREAEAEFKDSSSHTIISNETIFTTNYYLYVRNGDLEKLIKLDIECIQENTAYLEYFAEIFPGGTLWSPYVSGYPTETTSNTTGNKIANVTTNIKDKIIAYSYEVFEFNDTINKWEYAYRILGFVALEADKGLAFGDYREIKIEKTLNDDNEDIFLFTNVIGENEILRHHPSKYEYENKAGIAVI